VKYSVLVPYYKRLGHLHNTFISFLHHYSDRNDYEVVIAEDYKNVQNKKDHDGLSETIEKFREKIPIIHLTLSMETWNPAHGFNEAAKWASGEYFVVTNPECFHQVNILAGLDKEFEEDPNVYVVCGCMNYVRCNFFIKNFNDLNGKFQRWYQHSIHRAAHYHFCSAISKQNWVKIGGFDEDFAMGIAYDDVDFKLSIQKAKIPFHIRDDLLTIHIDHGSFPSPPNAQKLVNRNRITYQRKWEGSNESY